MKKALRWLGVLIAVMMLCTCVFAACNPKDEGCGDGNHKDADHDGVCDVCGQTGLVVVHTGGTATCQAKAVCSVCGKEYGNLGSHVWGPANCQTKPTCEICHETSGDFGPHVDKNYDNKCDVCNKVLSYTYSLATNSLPTSWNVHTYESNDATTVLGYTEDGFYDFDYNEDKTGYKWVLGMASAFPADVSSEYVGDEKWGITEKDTWRAIRVTIREDLYFDNGDHITANDFVESVKLLLDPDAANYRADSLYGGQFSVVGAEKYFKSGKTVWEDATEGKGDSYKDYNWGEVPEEDQKELRFYIANNFVTATLTEYGYFQEGYTKAQIYAYYMLGSLAKASEIEALEGKTLYEILNDTALKATLDAMAEWWCDEVGNGEEFGFFCVANVWDEFDFDGVGVIAVDDYTLDFIIEKSLSGFYLTYNLAGSMYLVNTKVYKENISSSQGAYQNSYGTSVDSYVGFGPYKLTEFVSGSIARFERNPYWYGYKDAAESEETLYQTTNIQIRQVSDANTRLQMFLAGQTDSYGLQEADMKDYQSSDYTYYTDGDSTWFIALNPNLAGLTSAQELAEPVVSGRVVNKTVITIKEFRMALSFSVDRAAYELALDPVGNVAKALFSNMIVSDPDNGTTYRSTQQAKEVICRFWGIDPDTDIGPDKEYETIDDAIASITGYDLAGAKTLFATAYEKAVEQGLIDPNTDWEVQIMIGQPGSGSSAYYNNGYTLLSQVWTAAVEGTPFEGRLTFKQSQPLGSSGFAKYLKNNEVDVLFGVGWTGSALDPYNLMEAYVDSNYQYDPGWDTKATMLDIVINGQTLRASVYAWGKDALQGNDITAQVIGSDGQPTGETVTINAGVEADPELRLNILAAVEGAVLEQYDMIPVGTEASATLKGMRIKFYTEEYVYGVGRGGIKYMTYTLDDADWAAFVQSQGGTLNYK